MYTNMQSIPIVDINLVFNYCLIGVYEQKRIIKFAQRFQDCIELSNPALLKQAYHIDSLHEILIFFKYLG